MMETWKTMSHGMKYRGISGAVPKTFIRQVNFKGRVLDTAL